MTRDLFSDGTVAHSSLRRIADAERFTDGALLRVSVPVADMRSGKDTAGLTRQVLYGHPVRRLEPENALSRDETSNYVGYVSSEQLSTWEEPTHRVTARSTLLFSEPNFKTPNPSQVSCGSLLSIVETDGRYARTDDGLYVIADHLVSASYVQPDLAATAAKLLGTPYLWGGNSAFGIDCSGLVQLACQTAHVSCPGDSDQQMAALGASLPQGAGYQRNDLLFWKGHVALVCDPETIIHANAHDMAVAYEPITDALKRIEDQGDGPLLDHRRL